MIARSFATVLKDATAQSVHVATALGNEKTKRKFKSFKELASAYVQKRELKPQDSDTAKTPFLYDVNALGSLRPDQVPRFFGALTDPDKLPDATVRFTDLHAMQDRVDPKKVQAIAESGTAGKKAVVIRHNGKHYIADGHHRLAAAWLSGEDKADVKLKDLEPVSNALKRGWSVPITVTKSDPDQQMIFGWASISTVDGKHIIDKQGDIIEPQELEKAAYDFVLNSRTAGDMHDNVGVGRLVESCVFTKQKQEALGIDLGKEGWFVGFKIDNPEIWAAHKRGERPEFSIGGSGERVPATAE